ncbi:hypothetical protein KSP39_PZI004495 [Platanthera zijinensis]|uniref:Uncharacterized protein n=1 Tax=Platanthera zijinensis TaxID=2320716 RepID=A0AAP0BVT7_9ASPA
MGTSSLWCCGLNPFSYSMIRPHLSMGIKASGCVYCHHLSAQPAINIWALLLLLYGVPLCSQNRKSWPRWSCRHSIITGHSMSVRSNKKNVYLNYQYMAASDVFFGGNLY